MIQRDLLPLATTGDLDPLQPDRFETIVTIGIIVGVVLFVVFFTFAVALFVRNLRVIRQQGGNPTITIRHEYPDAR